ncbi:MAG: hypothetical protein AAF827_20040 [Cyanobacteria bacterium P01_D01_bin.6]
MEASRADRDEKVENRFPILTAYKIFKAIDREQNIFMTVPLWLDVIVKLTPAFITLIVGSFGSWIAFSQYQTNKDKLQLDLFEKRLEAYEKVQEYFRHLVREASVTDEAFSLLAEARYKSIFLFDQDIVDHIDDILEKSKEMRIINLKLFGKSPLPVGQERSLLVERDSNLLDWNFEQMKDSPQRYSKYLKFK